MSIFTTLSLGNWRAKDCKVLLDEYGYASQHDTAGLVDEHGNTIKDAELMQ